MIGMMPSIRGDVEVVVKRRKLWWENKQRALVCRRGGSRDLALSKTTVVLRLSSVQGIEVGILNETKEKREKLSSFARHRPQGPQITK